MVKKVEITPEVRDVLLRGKWAGWLYRLPEGQLERRLYEAVDKVLRALGGKWHRGHQGHMFGLDAKKAMEAALADGHVVDQKKTLEQFFTPIALARRMTDILGLPARGIRHVLEPSAGAGALVQAVMEHGIDHITAVEIDPALCEAISGVIHHHGNALFRADFMTWEPVSPIPIDAVIMNPPFSLNQDIRHVRRAFDFLRPGGKLVAIMSPHFTFAEDQASKDFRAFVGFRKIGDDWAEPVANVCSVVELEKGTFRAEGTDVSAVLVTLEKAE